MFDNYQSVVDQMEAFGVEFTPRDLPLQIPTAKRKTCGKKGKYWYWLQEFRPRAGGSYVVGKFGTYKHGGSEAKVEVDWKPLSDEERRRYRAEQAAAAEHARRVKQEAADVAALTSIEIWRRASRNGHSPYFERKGVVPEACRFLQEWVRMPARDPRDKPITLPPGTAVVPLLRYDASRDEALRGLQFLKPDGFKIFTRDFAKTGCALRLGVVDEFTPVVFVCEGYATGLSIRMATDRQVPLYVALDAYNLEAVVAIVRAQHPKTRILICADDDWKTADHHGPNPGRRAAKAAAKGTSLCDLVWPVFQAATREEKDTDFNDLHLREGLAVVCKQLQAVTRAIERGLYRGR